MLSLGNKQLNFLLLSGMLAAAILPWSVRGSSGSIFDASAPVALPLLPSYLARAPQPARTSFLPTAFFSDAELSRKWLPPERPTPVPSVNVDVSAAGRETTVERPGRSPVTTRELYAESYDPYGKSIAYPLLRDAYKAVYRDLLGVNLATPRPAPSPTPKIATGAAASTVTDVTDTTETVTFSQSTGYALEQSTLLPQGKGQMFSVFADSSYIYGGNEDGHIYVWDRETFAPAGKLAAPGGMILSVHADPGSGGFIYGAGSENKIYLWRKTDFLYLTSLGVGQEPIEAVFSDNDYIYGAGADGYVYIWEKKTFLIHERLAQAGGLLASIRADEEYLYAGSGGLDDALYVWKKPNFALHKILRNTRDDVNSIHSDGKYIYAAADRNIYVWNRGDFSLKETIAGPGWGMNAVSGCDSYIYGANENGRIYVWTKAGSLLMKEIPVSDRSVLWVFADGDLLLAAGRDGYVYAWRTPFSDFTPSAGSEPTPGILGRYGITVAASPAPGPARTPTPYTAAPTPFTVYPAAPPRATEYSPVDKTLGYGLIQESYRKVYKEFFGVLLTTPTPPPTPIPTPTPVKVATPTPGSSSDKVVINEINWGGTLASDAGEWIELHNYGSAPVSVKDWKIENSTGNWTITITSNLTIIAGGYMVIARDSDPTGGKADFLYDKAKDLDNSGVKLILKNSAGDVKDTVNCTNGWFAGGQRISMERKNPAIDGSTSNNWGNAAEAAIYQESNRGTPKAGNSIATASTAGAGSQGDLTLEDYAYWIDFEEGRYFKLIEEDLGKLHPRAAQFDYLPNSAFIYLATGWKPSREYFRRQLLAMVRDAGFDWNGEETFHYIADVAEAYLAMAAEGVFTTEERKEIEEKFHRLALDNRSRAVSDPAGQGAIAGLNAAVGYILGGEEGKEMISWAGNLLSYDQTYSPPENSCHFSSLFVREMLRTALYRNSMTIPALDGEGKQWKENFARQVKWILTIFPHNGFQPAWGEEHYLNRTGHYLLPLVVATSVLDDGVPDNVRLARQAKWLAQRMFLYGAGRSLTEFGANNYGYHASQWGPFAVMFNPVYLWWFWNEDLPSLRPDEKDISGGEISRPLLSSISAEGVWKTSAASLSLTPDKVLHRSGWEDEAMFVMLDLAWPAAHGGDEYGFANSLVSLSYGAEEFLSGLVFSGKGFSPKMASLAEGMSRYRHAQVLTWEDNDAYSRSVTKVEDGGDSWTREVIVYKRDRREVEVIDTLSFPGDIRWHLQGEVEQIEDGIILEIDGTRLQVSWAGADGVSLKSYDSWAEADPSLRWSYAGSPDRALKLTLSGPGTVKTVFRGLEAAPPPVLQPASDLE